MLIHKRKQITLDFEAAFQDRRGGEWAFGLMVSPILGIQLEVGPFGFGLGVNEHDWTIGLQVGYDPRSREGYVSIGSLWFYQFVVAS